MSENCDVVPGTRMLLSSRVHALTNGQLGGVLARIVDKRLLDGVTNIRVNKSIELQLGEVSARIDKRLLDCVTNIRVHKSIELGSLNQRV